MSTDDPIKFISTSTTILSELVRTAGDTPQAKEAGKTIGDIAVTVAKAVNNILMPLAAVNFAFDKAKKYFEDNFSEDLSEKTQKIPPDQIIYPKAFIAAQSLQGLSFSHEDIDLKNMYLNLLATAMDKRVFEKAHPAFVEIIKQLSSEEALILKDIFRAQNVDTNGIIEIKLTTSKGSLTIATHVLNYTDEFTNQPAVNPELPAMVENWIRLGLVFVDYTHWLASEESYTWAELRPEFLNNKYRETDTEKLKIQHGIIKKTSFGTQFAKAVGLVKES
jgi:Abortive infection alpha